MPRAQTRTAKGSTLMEDDMKHWVNYLSILIVYTFANLNPNGPGSVKKCLEESVLYCISLVGGGRIFNNVPSGSIPDRRPPWGWH